jgi:hypothetical protein
VPAVLASRQRSGADAMIAEKKECKRKKSVSGIGN